MWDAGNQENEPDRNSRFPRLQRILSRDEFPRQFEFLREFGRERLHGVDLRRIVTAKVEIQPLFLRDVEPLLAQLARDEGVDPRLRQIWYRAVAAPAAE